MHNEVPPMHLNDAILAAVEKDDLDEACAIIEDSLGVTDGGLASMCLCDLETDPDSGQSTWSALGKAHRHARLIAYIKSEVSHIENP